MERSNFREVYYWVDLQVMFKDGRITAGMGNAMAFSMPDSDGKAYQVKDYWAGMQQQLSRKVQLCS